MRRWAEDLGPVRRSAGFLVVALVAVVAIFGACHRAPPPPPPLPTVRVAEVGAQKVEQTFEWLATLDGSTNAEIRPRVVGYIQSVDYQEGSLVTQGALLFMIDDRPLLAALLKARGDYENAVAQLNKAGADVARYLPLVAERAISRQELDDARSAQQAALATRRAAQGALQLAALNLNWSNVRSPIIGIAGIAQTRVGTLADPNQVLATVSTVDPIRASFYISEREYLSRAEVLNHINDPQYEAQRYLELILSNGQVHPYRARRIIVNRMIDPTTGTLLIQALFPNPGNILRPGLFARVRVHSGTQANVLTVPQLAVQEIQGTFRVAVVDDRGRVAIRPVKLGPLFDHSYPVKEGLQAGERVITEGLQSVAPGVQVSVQPVGEPPARPADAGR